MCPDPVSVAALALVWAVLESAVDSQVLVSAVVPAASCRRRAELEQVLESDHLQPSSEAPAEADPWSNPSDRHRTDPAPAPAPSLAPALAPVPGLTPAPALAPAPVPFSDAASRSSSG